MWIDDSDVNKLLRSVIPRIEATKGAVVTVQAGANDMPGEAVRWSDAVSFTVGQDRGACEPLTLTLTMRGCTDVYPFSQRRRRVSGSRAGYVTAATLHASGNKLRSAWQAAGRNDCQSRRNALGPRLRGGVLRLLGQRLGSFGVKI